jgi:hypothetical protein
MFEIELLRVKDFPDPYESEEKAEQEERFSETHKEIATGLSQCSQALDTDTLSVAHFDVYHHDHK